MTRSQLLAGTGRTAPTCPSYSLPVTRDGAELQAAQRLRHQVFAEELGARPHTEEPGLDIDNFDDYCDHLVVRHDDTGEVVGTYRMLPRRRGGKPVLRPRVRYLCPAPPPARVGGDRPLLCASRHSADTSSSVLAELGTTSAIPTGRD